MADLVITGALDTDHIGDIVFKPLTDQHNPGKIDTITPVVISGDAVTNVDPANPLTYTVDGVSATDSVIEYTVDMKPGAEVANYVVELHLTGTEPGTTSVHAEFTNVRLRTPAPEPTR